MSDDNKHNLIYFESKSMKDLFSEMEEWQKTNNKRLLSTNIQKDKRKFCCIALTNPSEVIICSGSGLFHQAVVDQDGSLWVKT
ncbi:MAG TPA: hypothetical protein VMC09_04165 [Anaerolineales bacterium]|nr:hypothetical protein [Anaerolineales bacterium]